MTQSFFYKSILFTTILISVYCTSSAQIDESYKYTYEEFDTNAEHNLYFRVESNNFVKNNEYFGEYTEGYTLPGYSLQPSLLYYVGKNIRLNIGAHFLRYSGFEDFADIVPIFSAHVKFGKNWNMILGNIKGDVHHRLIEPLYQPEWQYFRAQESGVQFYFQSSKLWLDGWMDWEQFILEGDTIPEIFTAGISLDYTVTSSDANLKLSIPFQAVATHLGGQISNYNEESYTLVNSAIGIKLSKNYNYSFLKKTSLVTYFCTYNDLTETSHSDFNKGFAIYPNGIITYNSGEITLGYWHASDFFAPRGSALFFSISDYNQNYYTKTRNIITSKFTYNKTLMKKVKFRAQFETYYDIEASELEYSYGIGLVFTPNFFITKLDFE